MGEKMTGEESQHTRACSSQAITISRLRYSRKLPYSCLTPSFKKGGKEGKKTIISKQTHHLCASIVTAMCSAFRLQHGSHMGPAPCVLKGLEYPR